jgi:hypothetical protein
MHQPWSVNRALYGVTPSWLLPAIFGSLMLIGWLQRLTRQRAEASGAVQLPGCSQS